MTIISHWWWSAWRGERETRVDDFFCRGLHSSHLVTSFVDKIIFIFRPSPSRDIPLDQLLGAPLGGVVLRIFLYFDNKRSIQKWKKWMDKNHILNLETWRRNRFTWSHSFLKDCDLRAWRCNIFWVIHFENLSIEFYFNHSIENKIPKLMDLHNPKNNFESLWWI